MITNKEKQILYDAIKFTRSGKETWVNYGEYRYLLSPVPEDYSLLHARDCFVKTKKGVEEAFVVNKDGLQFQIPRIMTGLRGRHKQVLALISEKHKRG